MNPMIRKIGTIVVGVSGAAGMFLLGVVTERQWAAKRMDPDYRLQMEENLAESQSREEEGITVDIRQLDFPEALQSGGWAGEDSPPGSDALIVPAGRQHDRPGKQHGDPPQVSRRIQPDSPIGRPVQIFIQIGAFSSRENAKKAISQFAARGIKAFIQEQTDASAAARFKVRIGPFGERSGASVTVARLVEHGIPHLIVTRP